MSNRGNRRPKLQTFTNGLTNIVPYVVASRPLIGEYRQYQIEYQTEVIEMADDDSWMPFGETRWRDFAETAGASELQLKFSVARFSGSSAAAAAKIAGYSGSSDDLRRAGYAAVRSTAVQNLLELAAINAPADAAITDAEIDAKIAKLIRSADPNVSLKAVELHGKRLAAKEEREATEQVPDILDELKVLAEISPDLAKAYADSQGVIWNPNKEPING